MGVIPAVPEQVLHEEWERRRAEHPDEGGWEAHDPERAQEALDKFIGAWADVDVDLLIEELRRAREEGSRSWDWPGPFED